MPEQSTRRQAHLAAAWLATGRLLDGPSTALTLLGLGLALWQKPEFPTLAGLLATSIVGCWEKYYAIRVNFDRQVFADWAKQWSGPDGLPPGETMAEFDAALIKMGLRRRPVETQRSLAERIAGSRRLLHKQALCLGLQCAILVGAVLARSALT